MNARATIALIRARRWSGDAWWYLRRAGRAFLGCAEMFLARSFGTCIAGGRNGVVDYHVYEWRGRRYFVPSNGRVDREAKL